MFRLRSVLTSRLRLVSGICVVAAAPALVVPLALGSDGPPEPIVASPVCAPSVPQPAQPLELNTVVAGSLVKTVAMEKEVFDCRSFQSEQTTEIIDAETFVEVIERATGAEVEMRVEVAECRKDFGAAVGGSGHVVCSSRDVPIVDVTDPLALCQPKGLTQPTDPVEMNTVVMPTTRLVKTIKVEKEQFRCPTHVPGITTSPDEIGDLYVFTEIIERPTFVPGLGTTLRPLVKRFEGIVCRKSVQPVPPGENPAVPAGPISCSHIPT